MADPMHGPRGRLAMGARAVLRSLRARLLLALLVPLGAVVMVDAALDYLSADRQAGLAQDRALAATAIGLSARLETDRDGDVPAHLVAMMNAVARLSPGDELYYLVRDARGGTISGWPSLSALIPAVLTANPSFVDAQVQRRPVRAAVYDYAGPDGHATIVVAQTLRQRTLHVREAVALAAAANALIALSVLGTALLAVGFALRPLLRMSQRLPRHEVAALRPIRLREVPTEIVPLARALNRLMRRLRRTVLARQAFISNTAHQLRTPLAGLGAQAQLLARQPLPESQAQRVREMGLAIERLSHLVRQLLALARADEDATGDIPMLPVELADVLQSAASACLDAALARDVDLGFEPLPAKVHGSSWMLHELLVNLVGNAIAHTPRGTVVTVRCGRLPDVHGVPHAYLEVEDDGPGIPVDDRERVFDRFVRLAEQDRRGTGLGLAIVREIAQRHGATVTLGIGAQGKGLRVRVQFPD
jgi:two-component system sensor histidine kinase TctE